jgi:4-carboxymuconolactone decarboxylase
MKIFQALAALILIGATAPGNLFAGSPHVQDTPNAARGSAAAKEETLPKDVFPDSFARVPLFKRETLNEADKKAYDELDALDARGGVGLRGPGGIWFYVPGLHEAVTTINTVLRKSGFSAADYEVATLITAREMNTQAMWTAHETEALGKGVSQETIDVIKYRKPAAKLGEKDATIIQFGRELFQKDIVSSATYARAEKVFGRQGVVILTAILAYRAQVGFYAKAFDQHLHSKLKPLLPIP